MTLLDIRDLTKVYAPHGRRGEPVSALDRVSFGVPEGGSVGVAGESGSGKTTLARIVLRLQSATSGAICFDGEDVTHASPRGLRRFRHEVQAVFQDSAGALSPRTRVRDIVAEPLLVQAPATPPREVDARIDTLLERVGLAPALRVAYPHQLSGGQKQRVAIARALSVRPRLLVLDEPVSALDVSIRSQVLNLLLELKEEERLAYLIIAHDLAVLRHVTRELVVIYRGRIVEHGPTDAVLSSPLHPYTRMLIAAVPRLHGARVRGASESEIDAGSPPAGCRFAPRCASAHARCRADVPQLVAGDGAVPTHRAACHLLAPTAPR